MDDKPVPEPEQLWRNGMGDLVEVLAVTADEVVGRSASRGARERSWRRSSWHRYFTLVESGG